MPENDAPERTIHDEYSTYLRRESPLIADSEDMDEARVFKFVRTAVAEASFVYPCMDKNPTVPKMLKTVMTTMSSTRVKATEARISALRTLGVGSLPWQRWAFLGFFNMDPG